MYILFTYIKIGVLYTVCCVLLYMYTLLLYENQPNGKKIPNGLLPRREPIYCYV